MILRIVLINAGEKTMIISLVSVNYQLVVSAVAESGSNDSTVILTWLSVKRKHQLAVGSMGVAHTVAVFDHTHSVCQARAVNPAFIAPAS